MIIDTNVYSNIAKNIKEAVAIFQENDVLYVPLFVIAELKFGFLQGSRTEYNTETLHHFLGESSITVLYPTARTANFYAELALLCKKAGKALSPNDIWIASLALENGMQLATFDKDFSVFTELLGDDLKILEY